MQDAAHMLSPGRTYSSTWKGITPVIYGRELDCLAETAAPGTLPIHAIRPEKLEDWLQNLTSGQAAYLRSAGFAAKAGQIALLPNETGLGGAVLGLGGSEGPHIFGALPGGLPPNTDWHIGEGIENPADCVLGFALGAYRFRAGKTGESAPRLARLARPAPDAATIRAASAAKAIWLARDLINTPANLLGPAELAEAARSVLTRNGGHVNVITGEALEAAYPAVHAVGRGSLRKPAVLVADWQAAGTSGDAPTVSICGKGICFDTGGYDLKPPAGMLRMKKDMGGAAIALALASMIAEAGLPCRMQVRLACAENMISGDAMRPLDILKTRKGLSVEVGNTDAEGRLVLCDLLAEACETVPAALLDFATLTGAARTALGPDLPALFSNDDNLAKTFLEASRTVHDPVWRLPLWDGYNSWLDSEIADLNNVSDKAHAGAIVAGLFLQRFVSNTIRWAHFDVYGWNDTARPGRPAGGEAQALRAVFEGLDRLLSGTSG
jgi:leucyl aminopeptidase